MSEDGDLRVPAQFNPRPLYSLIENNGKIVPSTLRCTAFAAKALAA
jgi:hypothetical protein